MKKITKSSAIHTCWIAEVKKEMGLRTRMAHNRLSSIRKVTTPERFKPVIKQAIKNLGENATYKEIQDESFFLLTKDHRSIAESTFGIIRVPDPLAREIALNKDIYYAE